MGPGTKERRRRGGLGWEKGNKRVVEETQDVHAEGGMEEHWQVTAIVRTYLPVTLTPEDCSPHDHSLHYLQDRYIYVQNVTQN